MSRLSALEIPVIGSEPVLPPSIGGNANEKPTNLQDAPITSGARSDPSYAAKRGKGPLFISSISKDEPLVTRKELWSYYCT
jgi:hypothetical protein